MHMRTGRSLSAAAGSRASERPLLRYQGTGSIDHTAMCAGFDVSASGFEAV
jgi:hypothetical protein